VNPNVHENAETMNPTPTRVLCLGIDAASPKLLRTWAAEGFLPNLRALMDRGLSGTIAGVDGFFVGSTWPSFYTGTFPSRHGFHYLVQLQPGSYSFHRPADHGISWIEPFWTHLSRAGKRVAILDVPLSRLDPTINGIQTVEWGGHDSVYGFQALPSRTFDTIRSRFGSHPLGPTCDGDRRTAEDFEAFVERLLEGVRRKTDLTRHFLREGGWDLFLQVFTESHCVGHQCWHLHDDGHPGYDAEVAAATGDPMLRVYQAVDEAVGEIMEDAGDATIFVFSGHGMAHFHGAQGLLTDILFRLGVATPEKNAPPRPTLRSGALAVARWVWKALPHGLREGLRPLRDRVLDRGSTEGAMPELGVDFSSSLCFPVPNGLAVGGIRLNLRGREPQGTLGTDEVEQFCGSLARRLLAFRHEPTGAPLIRRVHRTSEMYSGEHLGDLPDLLVEWDDTVPLGSVHLGRGGGAVVSAWSEETGSLEKINDWGRSGEHRVRGMFIAAGRGVEPGVLSRDVPITDLAPTLGRLVGVEIPSCDGTAIPELVSTRSAS